jgi:uncharacterized membrane protein YdjX (TVP38/TMEM64 family)
MPSFPVAADTATASNGSVPPASRSRTFKIMLTIILIVFIIVFLNSDLKTSTMTFLESNDNIVGWSLFVGVLAVSVISSIPSTPLEIVAGSIYGVNRGFVLAWTGKTLGSIIAFLISRYCLANALTSRMKDKKNSVYVDSLKAAIIAKPHTIICLTSAAFIPGVIKNYGLGSIDVIKVWQFTFWMAVCGIPYSFVSKTQPRPLAPCLDPAF